MILGLIGVFIFSIWANIAYYEYRVLKRSQDSPKTFNFTGYRGWK